MLSGKWELNGATIVFNCDGTLNDGQHRLEAIVKSGVAVQSFVVRGVTCGAKHIDRNKPRTIGQWLSHSGVKNATLVSAVARKCIAYEKGLWNQTSWGQWSND